MPITVAGLSHRSGIGHEPATDVPYELLMCVGHHESTCGRHLKKSLESGLLAPRVHVLMERIDGRSVDERYAMELQRLREPFEEGTSFGTDPTSAPPPRRCSTRIEPFEVPPDHCIVMVPLDTPYALIPDPVHDLLGEGAVPYNITKTPDLVAFQVGQNCLQGVKVAVDVCDEAN